MVDELKHIIAGEDYQLNQYITIHNPTLHEVIALGESTYYWALQLFTSRPYDAMVFLYDMGLHHEDIDEFDFFIQKIGILCKNLNVAKENVDSGLLKGISLLFPGMDFSCFCVAENMDNGEICLHHEELDFVIDKLIYKNIATYLRRINYIPEKVQFEKIGNEITRKMIVKKLRKQMENQKHESQFSNFVSALVNSNGFKYDYETIKNLHISQFWDSFMRINKILNYNQTMQGVYAGTVDYSKISDKESISWISDLKVNKN